MRQVGFTGTQTGMTLAQQQVVKDLLSEGEPGIFRHGDCVGADHQAAEIARTLGWVLVCHPPINPVKRAYVQSDVVLYPQEYLMRNHAIVDACTELLAAPATATEQRRSGTWATVRYARKTGKPVTVVNP